MSDPTVPLPELRTAELDTPGLDALLGDIARCAQLLEIVAKSAPRSAVPALRPRLTLDDARRLLESRQVRGLQVRYLHEGAEWWDSILCQDPRHGGPGPESRWRLVRIRHNPA